MVFDPCGAVQAVAGQFGGEFVRLKTVFAWMDGECAEHPGVEDAAGGLLRTAAARQGAVRGPISEMACCHWGTWWMMPKSTTVSWLAAG